MTTTQPPQVAVLMPTYNGAKHVRAQIESLTANAKSFTLHWLDDHSTDDTRNVVRAAARDFGIELREYHQAQRLQVPGAFFQLLECVDADIYLFCDQDDIWQPGKIDATVANLLPDLASPVLCYSDPFLFYDDEGEVVCRGMEALGATGPTALAETRSLMFTASIGHTIGFTRPLREIFLRHKDIAREYAFMHDCWMYTIANACGACRMLSDVPTTLWRRHPSQYSGVFLSRRAKGVPKFSATWVIQHTVRQVWSRHAQGFIRASKTLTPGPKLERLVKIAHLVANLHRRQSLATLIRLARLNAMWPSRRVALMLTAACLWCDAKAAAVAQAGDDQPSQDAIKVSP
jgi:glycosyltransferase involved in cell wall biosynthesis